MNLKKLGAIAVTGLAAVMLAACSKDTSNTDVITMKGDTIRVSDLYKEAQEYPTTGTTTLLQNMTFDKIFEKEFGKKVTTKKVEAEFQSQKTSLGTQFASALQQAGYTETSYKDSIRSQLLLKAAVNKEIKYTTAEYKTAFETFHPTVDAYILSVTSESDAKTAISEANKSATDFDKTAKEKKAEIKFDSANTQVPDEVKAAAWKLKDGAVSAEPVAVTDSSTGEKSYYIIKMIKNSDKGTDWKKYKSELKSIIETTKQNDTTFVNGIIATYLTKYNVTVKPTAFATIFSAYETTATSTSSSSKASSSTKASSSASSESSSSTASSTSTSESK
ncbi:foldase [Pseudolactococcus insecticola]|uniref:Foldase protein PrsA n=1 Tax=Pseudolactococcus insecticola TaxID=2709158 RepID=A0A6A0B544_9LACT|nr:foldase [Lactococcus insecticola]GFH39815.1 foldase protein PrsA [Lactococcus insecticola]